MSLTRAEDGYLTKDGKTDAQLYLEKSLDGEIIVGEWIRKLADFMLPRLEKGEYRQWHFDLKKATRPIRFIETFCCIPSGKLGTPFILESYERLIIELTFGWVDDGGLRQFKYLLIEIARKNGKTSLAAALELYMLTSDGEGAPQCYNLANSKPQASLSFGAVCNMKAMNPYLNKHIRKGVIQRREETGLIFDANMGYLVTLSANPNSLDGLDTSFFIYDELAAARDRSLFDLMVQSTSAREQPLQMVISTQGFVRYNIWDTELDYAKRVLSGDIKDDTMLPILFELDDRSEWDKEDCWVKANPGLGSVKKISALRDNVNKAKEDSSFLPTLLTKDFNVPATQACAYFSYEEAVNPTVVDYAEKGFRYAIVGFDAADTIDLTAATALMMVPDDDHIYERSMYWIPEDSISIETSRKERDDVPYHLWEEQGLIRIVPGNKVDKAVIFDWLAELQDEGIYTFAFGYDPWHVDDTTLRNLKMMIGEERVMPIRQGVKTLSQPMKQIRADFKAGKVINNHNPIDEWCRMNTSVKVDINGNIQPVKGNGSNGRIDGFMSELDAYIVLQQMADDYKSLI